MTTSTSISAGVSVLAYGLYLVVAVCAAIIASIGTLAFRNSLARSTVEQLNQLLTATEANFKRVDLERVEGQRQISELQGQIKVLRDAVTQRAAVDELAKVEAIRHHDLMAAMTRLVTIADATAKASGVPVPPAPAG